MRRRVTTDQGFSFIELLAYMAIAALLILAAVPQFGNYRAKAYDSIVHDEMRSYALALEGFTIDHPTYPMLRADVHSLVVTFTDRAYWPTSNKMLYCGFANQWGLVARSASGATFLLTNSGESTRYEGVQFTSNTRVNICPDVGQRIGAGTAVAADDGGAWLHTDHMGWVYPTK